MKFVFITAMLAAPWGGSEELWSQAAVRLRLAGHEVCALVPHRPRLSDKILALSEQGVEIRTYPAPSYIEGRLRHSLDRITLRMRRVHSAIKQLSPDLVLISQGEISGGLQWATFCRQVGIPYALMVHCNSELLWFQKDEIELVRAAYTNAKRVFCVSNANLELLRLQLGDALPNAEVVWNPQNVSSESISSWPSETDGWCMACVARLDTAAKGQDILLQIMARAEWRDRPVEVSFFGEGCHDVALRQIEKMLQLKNVRFRGHVDDVRAIWEQSHILLQPSRYEGVPMTVTEAMICGRPVVVTDVGRTAELCLDNETGFVAQAATVAAFAEAMERAWQRRSDWRQMGHEARTRAEHLIPKDPVAIFCHCLETCAANTAELVSSRSEYTSR